MKKKILLVLLIIIMLLANFSIYILPVHAKILQDYEDSWIYDYYWDDNWLLSESGIQYEGFNTVDEYLNIAYKDYENVNKNEITRLFINNVYNINDLSGLYDFPNLTELHMDYFTNADAIKTLDLSKIPNLKKLSIAGYFDINDLGIDKLSNLTYIEIYTYETEIEFNLDLSNMKDLKHFALTINSTLTENDKTEEELLNNIKQQIIPLDGYEALGYGDLYDENYYASFYLIEPINVEIWANKSNYGLGEKVTTTVSWDKGVQATDFEILFDSSKLKLNSASIGEDFYNVVEPGRILVSWASFEEIDTTEIYFEFKTVGTGETDIVIFPENFANGELDSDFLFEYECKCSINIEKNEFINESSSIEIDDVNNREVISGLTLIDDTAVIQSFLDEKHFSQNLVVKIFNQKDEEVTDSSKGLGTGYKVRLYSDGEMVKEYLVVVYGDTTGEGEITAFDALTLIKVINKKIEFSDNIFYKAGRIITKNENEPTAIDALAIVKHLNKKYTIIQ